MMVVALMLAIMVGLGMLLLVLGLRGRRVGTYPVCRKCRFDLEGAMASATPCLKCGKNISLRVVQIGRRKRIRSGILAGSLCLLLSLVGGLVMVWGWASGFDWNTVKPVAWLLREAEGRDPVLGSAALAELSSRLSNGKIHPATSRGFIDEWFAFEPRLVARDTADWEEAKRTGPEAEEALARTMGKNWGHREAWGELVQQVIANGTATPEQITRFVEQNTDITLHIRPRIPSGTTDIMKLYAWDGGGRIPDPSPLRVRAHVVSLEAGGQPLHPVAQSDRMKQAGRFDEELQVPVDLPPGHYTITATMEVLVYRSRDDAEPVGRIERVQTSPVDILPADAPVVALEMDPAQVAACAKGIRVVGFLNDPGDAGRELSVCLEYQCPLAVVGQIIFRAGEREWEMGMSLYEPHAGGPTWTSWNDTLPADLTADKVDVIFRPDAALAAKRTLQTVICGEEIVLHDVPLERNAAPERRRQVLYPGS